MSAEEQFLHLKLRDALWLIQQDAAIFRRYEKQHRKKKTLDGDVRAEMNRSYALALETFLKRDDIKPYITGQVPPPEP